jgi:hypothetical protein
MRLACYLSAIAILCLQSAIAFAATVNYANEMVFQDALTGGFTVINTSVLGPNIGKTTAELSSQTAGAEFFGPPSNVRSDGLIPNGTNIIGGVLGLNFDPGVNAVGVTSNMGDGGRIKIFDGAGGTGNLLGEVQFGVGNGWLSYFGGIISTQEIRSAIFTCEFDFDIRCGLIDPTFGLTTVIPVPSAAWLFGTALGLLGWVRRKTA